MTTNATANLAVLYDARQRQWLRFTNPVTILTTTEIGAVPEILNEVTSAVKQKLYAVGFATYEAAPAFDPALTVKPDTDLPLAWFSIYSEAQAMRFPAVASVAPVTLSWKLSVTEEIYRTALQRIKDYIHAGDTYQVNYTFRMRTPFRQDPWQLFVRMIHAQGYGYGAFINTDDWSICSASHELFFAYEANCLTSRPMKGTAPRGMTLAGDQEQANWLQHSAKNRAENLMIVDMVRNDIGHIAETGSVQTCSLFDIEKYPTLWQMTSTVQATTRVDIGAIFRALFPPASITGAPKARTMEIIAELETEPRKIYTGSIGFVRPDQSAQFNVAIRTVYVDKNQQTAEYGVGGGIVWDSEIQNELEECHTKARVLTHVEEEFDLLETLLWTPEQGYTLLPFHLERLQNSAVYFSRPLDPELLRVKLAETATQLTPQPHRIRLRLTRSGEIVITTEPLQGLALAYRIHLASRPVDPVHDLYLHHKTTRRQVYQQLLAEHPGYDDVLLYNTNNEITESCIANVVVEVNGLRVTPPLSCGLLPGTRRRDLLEKGEIQEGIIKMSELLNHSKIFLINSVRGMWEATLTTDRQSPVL